MSNELTGAFEDAMASLVIAEVTGYGLTAYNVTTGFTDETKDLPSIVCAIVDNEPIRPRSNTARLSGYIEVNSSNKDKYVEQSPQGRHGDLINACIDLLEQYDIKTQITAAAEDSIHVYEFEIGKSTRAPSGLSHLQTTISFNALCVYLGNRQFATDSVGNIATDSEGNLATDSKNNIAY